MSREAAPRIEGPQHCDGSRKLFDDLTADGLDTVPAALPRHQGPPEANIHGPREQERYAAEFYTQVETAYIQSGEPR